jgi:nitric oxide reductase NorD protein
MAREKIIFQQALDQLGKQYAVNQSDNDLSSQRPRRVIKPVLDPDHPDEFSFQSAPGSQPIQLPAHMRALVRSIIQDHGRLPEEYFWETTDENPPAHEEQPLSGPAKNEVDGGERVFVYKEWDFRRNHYRKDWCVLRERDVFPYDDPFVARTLEKYRGELPTLRKTFEALRGENRLLKKQINGDNVDFDALVEAQADMKTGRELSERLFTKLHKHERNIAVMFMVDMSGSTKGWINDAEREALVLLCEALEILGDRYAIYGFSGMTRKRCDLYRIKQFSERYSDDVRRRIAGLQPQDYTRMGVTIRHLTKLLNSVDARTKLLITLSDGRPDDYDGYRGEYGIEDTRMSLIEAKRCGIHPFCITIDEAARDYLPHMYGAVNWVRVDEIRKLPVKVSEIYRRLTM